MIRDNVVIGPSHAKGGVMFKTIKDRFVAIVEGGEGVVSKKNMGIPVVKDLVHALATGLVDLAKLQEAIVTKGIGLPSAYLDDGGEAGSGGDAGGDNGKGKGDDGGGGNKDEAKFTQNELDKQIQIRLKKQEKSLTTKLQGDMDTKIADAIATAQGEWGQAEKDKKEAAEKGEWDDTTKDIVTKEQRKWQAQYDQDTKSLQGKVNEGLLNLEKILGEHNILKGNQKTSIVKNAMLESKIEPRYLAHLMPALLNRIQWSDELADFIVLDKPGDPDSIVYNPKDKDKGVYSVADYIKEIWSADPDLVTFRSDFKHGPGAGGGRGAGGSGDSTNLTGAERIARGLKQNLKSA